MLTRTPAFSFGGAEFSLFSLLKQYWSLLQYPWIKFLCLFNSIRYNFSLTREKEIIWKRLEYARIYHGFLCCKYIYKHFCHWTSKRDNDGDDWISIHLNIRVDEADEHSQNKWYLHGLTSFSTGLNIWPFREFSQSYHKILQQGAMHSKEMQL